MNPSSSGWIPKFLTIVDKDQIIQKFDDDIDFYNQLKFTGFLFGVSTQALTLKTLSELTLTTEEYTKLNLFYSLLYSYYYRNPTHKTNEAIISILNFYKIIEKGKTTFLQKITLSRSPSDNLEQVLSARLQESNSILKKNESKILPYSLLFLDILAFRKFLDAGIEIKYYEQELESSIINYCFLALKSKKDKGNLDLEVINQIESSAAYLTNENHLNTFLSLENLSLHAHFNLLEKKYILDLCCLAIWNDKNLDSSEKLFLEDLIETLQLSKSALDENLVFIKNFSEKHSKSIKLFQSTNPLNQLYKQTSSTVKLLIIRNKHRLTKELEESGELVKLIGQSTLRELSTEEKDKVKEQLLDICKTIPSLTIFLIPGGSLLLPLLVKYIPSLLPSSFQENKINKKNKN